MKKMTVLLLAAALLGMLALPVMAASEPSIVRQIQNSTYGEYALANYEVTAYGYNLYCTWYMEFEGRTYNISDTSVGIQPWEPYAGETYGALEPEVNGAFTTFRYVFRGIGTELDGAKLYAVITNGTDQVISRQANIRVAAQAGTPPKISVVSEMEIDQGENLALYCQAEDPLGGTLRYLWYETFNGELENIIAVNGGSQTSDTLEVDTSNPGVYYYVCGVNTSNGGSAYSSVIQVTILEKSNIQVRYTDDSRTYVGRTMTVDIEAILDEDARIWNAFLERDVKYQWYLNGMPIDNATNASLKLDAAYEGAVVHVVITCYDLAIRGVGFKVTQEQPPLEITTQSLPDGTVGMDYSVQLQTNATDVLFEDWAAGTEGTTLQSLGLTVSAEGKITGVPVKEGTFSVTIHASSGEYESQKTYTLTIEPGQPDKPTEPDKPSEPPQEPVMPTKPAVDKNEQSKESKEDLPGWGYVVLGVIGAGIVIAVILALKKKR